MQTSDRDPRNLLRNARSAALALGLLVLGLAGSASASYVEEMVCTTGPGMDFSRGADGSVTVFFRPGRYNAPAPGECIFARRAFHSGDGNALVLGTHGPFSRLDADRFAHQLQNGSQFSVQVYNHNGQQHITHLLTLGQNAAPPPTPPPVYAAYDDDDDDEIDYDPPGFFDETSIEFSFDFGD